LAAYIDLLENDASTSLVLELHQLLGMLALLIGGLAEEGGEVVQGHILAIEVKGLHEKERSFYYHSIHSWNYWYGTVHSQSTGTETLADSDS